jgi:hypothetical protein
MLKLEKHSHLSTCRPSGAFILHLQLFPRLTPWATFYRPFSGAFSNSFTRTRQHRTPVRTDSYLLFRSSLESSPIINRPEQRAQQVHEPTSAQL